MLQRIITVVSSSTLFLAEGVHAQLNQLPKTPGTVNRNQKPNEFTPGSELLVQVSPYLMPIEQNIFSSIGSKYSSGGTVLRQYNEFEWCDVDNNDHKREGGGEVAERSGELSYRGLDLVQYRFNMQSFEPFKDTVQIPKTTLCTQLWTEDAIKRFTELVDQDYAWAPSLDKVPAALSQANTVKYNMKVPLGYKEYGQVYIYNHLDMVVKVAPVPNKDSAYHIVGFQVEPKSINQEKLRKAERDQKNQHKVNFSQKDQIGDYLMHQQDESHLESEIVTEPQALQTLKKFEFSYSVTFQQVEDVTWHNRLDKYFNAATEVKESKTSLHWVQLFFATLVLCVCTVALVRAMKAARNKDTTAMRDLNKRRQRKTYMSVQHAEDDDELENAFEDRRDEAEQELRMQVQKMVAWRKIHANIFRPPKQPFMLAILLGAGWHALASAALTIVISFFKGTDSVVKDFIVMFPFVGFINGRVAASMYVLFNGARWKRLALASALFYPLVLSLGYFLISLVDQNFASKLFGEDFSLKSFTYLTLLINLPGTLYGAYFGFTSSKIDPPTKQSRIRREIPDFDYNKRAMRSLVASLVPLVAILFLFAQFSSNVFSVAGAQEKQWTKLHNIKGGVVSQSGNELDFDFSKWKEIILFTMATLVYLVVVAEVTIVHIYLILCDEDFRWHWMSFKVGASPARNLFIFAIVIKMFVGHSTWSVILAQLTTVALYCALIGLVGATVSFQATLYFVKYLYGSMEQKTK